MVPSFSSTSRLYSTNSTAPVVVTEESDLTLALPTLHKMTKNNGYRNNIRQQQQGMTNEGRQQHSEPFNDAQRIPKNIPRLSDILHGRVHSKHHNHDMSTSLEEFQTTQIDDKPNRVPWRATFNASVRTQGRIKKAFSITTAPNSDEKLSPSRHAQNILEELLNTPPQYCNAVNIVCALTYSAKAMGQVRMHQHPDVELRRKLQQTLDILHELVVVHKDDQLLSPRQLCNVCWAIAKHFDRDPFLLPPSSNKHIIQSTDMMIVGQQSDDHQSTSWEWNCAPLVNVDNRTDDSAKDSPECRLQETVEEIAVQLTSILSAEHVDRTSSYSGPKIKAGEICMACWAFGKLKPREVPPGWHAPPQVGQVTTRSTVANDRKTEKNMPIIKFEQLGLSGGSRADNNGSSKHAIVESEQPTNTSSIDKLFNVIAEALCRSPKSPKRAQETVQALTLLEDCTWSELANVGWAFASHGWCCSDESEAMLITLAEEAAYRLKGGQSLASNNHNRPMIRDITQLLWSLGTLQADNFRLAGSLVHLVEALTGNLRLGAKLGYTFVQGRPLRRWSCADLVQTSVALAHARIDEQLLLRAIYEESIHRLLEGSASHNSQSKASNSESMYADDRRQFHPWEASILLWAQARLYLTEELGQEFDEFASDAPKFFLKTISANDGSFSASRIGPQEQANIVWSLVVLEKYGSPEAVELIQNIFLEAARSCKDEKRIQLEHAHQLWQAYFILEEECREAVQRVPKWFVMYLREKWSLEKSRDKLSSARHCSLSNTLQLMGVNHINEHEEDIDVAIILKPDASWSHQTEMDEFSSKSGSDEKQLLAVEFDGPNHFTRVDTSPGPPRALGQTILKYRLLKKQGWTVVRVPYYEFDKIPFWASMERQRYLQRKLKTHANLKFSDVDISEYKALTPNRESRFD
jgi:hypothetical protein